VYPTFESLRIRSAQSNWPKLEDVKYPKLMGTEQRFKEKKSKNAMPGPGNYNMMLEWQVILLL
jgi:hypothetical protein